jgi:hypothetical protein
MEFNINNEIKNKLNLKLFLNYDKDGISYYDNKKLDKISFVITDKSIKDTQKWSKIHGIEQYNQIETNIFSIIKIYDNDKTIVTSTQKNIWNIVKTMLLIYCDLEKRERSLFAQFKDIKKIKCELVDLVKLKNMDHYNKQLKQVKEKYNTFTNKDKDKHIDKNKDKSIDKDIYKLYYEVIRTEYPEKAKMNTCYIYSYYNLDDKIDYIVYPEEIKTINDLQKIVELLYLRTINIKKGYKLISKEKYYFLIELFVLLDKKYESLNMQNKNIIVDTTFSKVKIKNQLNLIGYNTYNEIQDFSKQLQKINNQYNKLITEKKRSKKKKTKITQTTQPTQPTKKEVVKKSKQVDDNGSTVVSDSEDYTSDDSDDEYSIDTHNNDQIVDNKITKPIKKEPSTIITNKKIDKTEIINRSIGEFIKSNLKKKKYSYVSIQTIMDKYKHSSNFKMIKPKVINITRTHIVDYLGKYKWFNDNFKAKHKDIRSVIVNYTLD